MPPTSDAARIAPVTHTVVDSPLGPLTLVARAGTLCGLYMQQPGHRPPAAAIGTADAAAFPAVAEQLAAYFSGELTAFTLDHTLDGTPFQRRVWAALTHIPYGQTISYGELARRIGQPTASRAVGLANGRNPLSIVVPCHRVIGADGRLTGYGGGIERKRLLLKLERRRLHPNLDVGT